MGPILSTLPRKRSYKFSRPRIGFGRDGEAAGPGTGARRGGPGGAAGRADRPARSGAPCWVCAAAPRFSVPPVGSVTLARRQTRGNGLRRGGGIPSPGAPSPRSRSSPVSLSGTAGPGGAFPPAQNCPLGRARWGRRNNAAPFPTCCGNDDPRSFLSINPSRAPRYHRAPRGRGINSRHPVIRSSGGDGSPPGRCRLPPGSPPAPSPASLGQGAVPRSIHGVALPAPPAPPPAPPGRRRLQGALRLQRWIPPRPPREGPRAARPAPPLPVPDPAALPGGARTPRTPAPPLGGPGPAGPCSARGCAAPAAAPARPRLPQKNKSPTGTGGGKGARKNNSRGGKRECSQSGNSLFISQKYILSCTIWFTHMYIFTVCTKTNNNNKKIETPNPHWTSKNLTNSANPDDNTEAGIFFSFLVLIYRHAYKL